MTAKALLMVLKILIINGHPDPSPDRFYSALAGAYAESAQSVGHELNRFDIGRLELPLLASAETFETDSAP